MEKTSKDDKHNYLIGALFVFFGAILFSTKAILVKLAYQYEVDSISLLALRMLFSLPIFLGVAVINLNKKSGLKQISQKDWLKILALGACGYYLASLLDFIGLQYITASLERVVLYVYPTIVLVLSALFLKKKIQGRQVIALLVAYIGIAIAFFDNLEGGEQADMLLGGLFVFGAAVMYAIYIVGSGELLPKIGTRLFNSLSMSAAGIAVVIHYLIANGMQLTGFDPMVYWYGFLMGIISTVIPSFMIAEGIRRVGANNGAIIGSIGPISTIILAYFFLEERLTIIQWGGTALVILGVVLIIVWKE